MTPKREPLVLREPKVRRRRTVTLEDGSVVYVESSRKKALYTPLPSGIKAHMRKEEREEERARIREERAAAKAREKANRAARKRSWHPYLIQGGRQRA